MQWILSNHSEELQDLIVTERLRVGQGKCEWFQRKGSDEHQICHGGILSPEQTILFSSFIYEPCHLSRPLHPAARAPDK